MPSPAARGRAGGGAPHDQGAQCTQCNIEVGLDYGVISIEDFGTNPCYGGDAAYHITEDFFTRANGGRSTAGKTSFET